MSRDFARLVPPDAGRVLAVGAGAAELAAELSRTHPRAAVQTVTAGELPAGSFDAVAWLLGGPPPPALAGRLAPGGVLVVAPPVPFPAAAAALRPAGLRLLDAQPAGAAIALRFGRADGPEPEPILIQTSIGCRFACGDVRVLEPEAAINGFPGVTAVSREGASDLAPGGWFARKVFAWQRVPLSGDEGRQTQRKLLQRGYVVVAELDDDPDNAVFRKLGRDYSFVLRSCHAVQTSTEPLAERLRAFNPNVKVLANQLARLPDPPAPRSAGAPCSVFFGALNREPDWADLMPALNRLAAKHGPALHFRVVHDRGFFDALRTPHKHFTPTCDPAAYFREQAACDVALLPLSPTPTNGMKSDLKYLECAARGVAVLASPTVYAASVQHGETGVIFDGPGAFERELDRIVAEPEWRRRLAVAARADVAANRMLAYHARARLDWYRELTARREELTRELLARVPELA